MYLQHTATHCNTLQHTATHCNTLRHTATHCITLQHTATYCNTLQHTATHCNTLQHTATHCSVLQLRVTPRVCKCSLRMICHLTLVSKASLLQNKGAKCSLIIKLTPQSKSVYWQVVNLALLILLNTHDLVY